MGCVTSKHNVSDAHKNLFTVTNVDDMGHLISPGQLEVTETELVLHQRGKASTRWPLRCLRKYGCDSELFTFECGRRCPTGAGIYAFRCRKAEQLFNVLQQNLTEDSTTTASNSLNPNSSEFPMPSESTGPAVHRRVPSQPEGYLNPTNNGSVRSHPTLSRPGSLVSNGPASPPTTSPPHNSTETFEHNNNKRGSLIPEHQYTNASIVIEAKSSQPSYINLSSPRNTCENYANLPEAQSHLYMNVNTATKDMPNQTDLLAKRNSEPEIEDVTHNYANVDTTSLSTNFDLNSPSIPQTPTYVPVHMQNYIELDLVPSAKNNAPAVQQVDSPNETKKSYVTIDFDKTNALSHSTNPRIEVEEGSRKTRHNSTICDVPTSTWKQRNSLSD